MGSETRAPAVHNGIHTLIIIHLARQWDVFHRRFLIHALAAALPRGWAVLAVNRPLTCEVTPIKYPRRLVRELPHRVPRRLAPSLYLYTPWQPLHEITAARLPGMTRLNRRVLRRQLRRIAEKIFPGVKHMFSWIYHPNQHWTWKIHPEAQTIYECFDDNARHPNGVPRADMWQRELRLLADTDLAFFTADLLAESRSPRVHRGCYLPNGVPAFMLEGDDTGTADRSGAAGIQVGYLGNWYEFMATELLHGLCRDNPQWNFVFAGPVKQRTAIQELQRLPNVTFRGPLPYDHVPAFIRGLDVALIPFVLNDYVRATNPLKTYEYMAAGVPIVASALPELQRFSDIICITENTPQAFAAAITAILKDKRNELSPKLIATAREYTWEAICRKVVLPELLRLADQS